MVDAGHKAVAVDSGLPLVWQRPDIRYVSASDEHGKLDVGSETVMPVLGEKLRLVPGQKQARRRTDRFDVAIRGRIAPGLGQQIQSRGGRQRAQSPAAESPAKPQPP